MFFIILEFVSKAYKLHLWNLPALRFALGSAEAASQSMAVISFRRMSESITGY